jgi:hypothetical protein
VPLIRFHVCFSHSPRGPMPRLLITALSRWFLFRLITCRWQRCVLANSIPCAEGFAG